MFTDAEIGLALRYRRQMNSLANDAQRIVDRKDDEIAMLTTALRAARNELARERARRIAAELRIEEILDTPI